MDKGAVITGKKLDLHDAVLPDGEVKRIFIGGIGAGITTGDMVNIFSPIGRVHAVEFVRTNGRNFAFMDFEPSSDRSLAKLFSTYNGCTWRGGKLKLEIAKEPYLTRLKREWAEDIKLASVPPPTKENLELVRSHSPSQEISKIRIYFPKLRKVKPLPFKGTGKHKYSFQRIEVPPLPIHFCDCEEHSKALEATSQKYLSPLSIVVHEKERNMITNVINKLMGGDKDEIPSDKKMQVALDPKLLNSRNVETHSIEAEVSESDDDNLVMNIGVGAEDDILMQLKGGMTQLTCQESGFGDPQSFKSGLVPTKADSGKRKKSEGTNASSIKPNKRARPVSADGHSKPVPTLAISNKLTSTDSIADSVPSLPLISSEGSAHAPKILAETQNTERQTSQNMSNSQPAEGQSWLQKASWKDLVGGRGNSSFSISNVLSGLISASPEMHKAKIRAETLNAERQNGPNTCNAQSEEGQSWIHKSSWKDIVGGRGSSSFSLSNVLSGLTSASPEIKHNNLGEKSRREMPQNGQISPGIDPKAPIRSGTLEKKSKKSSSPVEDKPIEGLQEQRKQSPESRFGEACPFMRNAESEQQWSKAKAALSGYLKKTSNESKASILSEGKPQSRR